jgi:uncharacterized protein (DUF433 family)
MAIQTQTISAQEARKRLPALLEMTRFHKRRFIIEEDGTPVAMLSAADAPYGQKPGRHPYVGRIEGINDGEPIILGTRISVARIVQLLRGYGSVDEILASMPHLTRAQVYDALSYYYDHEEEIEHLMDRGNLENVLARSGLTLEEVAEEVYEGRMFRDE